MHSPSAYAQADERAGPAWLVASMLTAPRRLGESLGVRGAHIAHDALRGVC